jgi:hypothetical protein
MLAIQNCWPVGTSLTVSAVSFIITFSACGRSTNPNAVASEESQMKTARTAHRRVSLQASSSSGHRSAMSVIHSEFSKLTASPLPGVIILTTAG